MNHKWKYICLGLLALGITLSATAATESNSVSTLNKDIRLTAKRHDTKIALQHDYSVMIRKKGLKAVAVNILVENKSANPVEINWATFKIKDQEDNVFDASIYATGPRDWLNDTVVQPGDKMAVWIAFEVNPGIVMEKALIRYESRSNSTCSEWFPVGGAK